MRARIYQTIMPADDAAQCGYEGPLLGNGWVGITSEEYALVRIPMSKIAAMAACKPPGFTEAIMSAGRLSGAWMAIPPAAWQVLVSRYGWDASAPSGGGCPGCGG